MSQRATVYRVDLSVADLERQHYADYPLTLARHASETEERLMVRVLAFALHAHERLAFAGDLSTDDEPALWRRDLTGSIEHWIEVGLPDERVLRKASGRADAVDVLAYGGRRADLWWQQNQAALTGMPKLTVSVIDAEAGKALAGMASRNLQVAATIQDGQVLLTTASGALSIDVEKRR